MFINLWCCSLDNALVRTSATMCSIGQYSNQTSPFWTHSWTKWCCTSMCFVHAWWVGFLGNDNAPRLSHQITITFFSSMYPKSIINFVIHMASFVACVFAMYSASMVDNAIVGCPLLLQEIAPPPIMKTNLVVDLLSSRSPPQSASQYPSTSLDWRAPKSRGETHLRVSQSQVAESWDLEAHSRLPTLKRGRGSSWEPKD